MSYQEHESNQLGAFVYYSDTTGYDVYIVKIDIDGNIKCIEVKTYSDFTSMIKDIEIFIKRDHWCYMSNEKNDIALRDRYNNCHFDFEIPGILLISVGHKKVTVYANSYPRKDKEQWGNFLLSNTFIDIPKSSFNTYS